MSKALKSPCTCKISNWASLSCPLHGLGIKVKAINEAVKK